MISPQSTILNFASAGGGLPGTDTAGGETLPEPAGGADFAPWVALALGAGAELTPPPALAMAATGEPGVAALPADEGAPAPLAGGQLLPVAVAGLPVVAESLVSGPLLPAQPGRISVPTNVRAGRDGTVTLAATLALEAVDPASQWTLQDDSIDVDLAQIDLARQLPDVALLRRHTPQATLTGDGQLPDPSWNAVLGEARNPTAAATPRGTVVADGQPLPAPPGNQAEFDRAVSQRMVWMLRNGHQDAQLKVHPEHLGSIDIQVNIDGDDARLSLTAANHVVRDALESAVPRLRELLNDAGLNLAQVNVGTGERGHNGALPGDAAAGRGPGGDSAVADEGAAEATPVAFRTPVGLVDTFA